MITIYNTTACLVITTQVREIQKVGELSFCDFADREMRPKHIPYTTATLHHTPYSPAGDNAQHWSYETEEYCVGLHRKK